jgi:hypothetical protein
MKAVMNELEKNDDIILFYRQKFTLLALVEPWFPRCNMFKPAGRRRDQCMNYHT